MFDYVYVPAAGRIASATAQNRSGPLPMQAPSGGGRARACSGRLQRRGTSLLQSRQVRRGKIGPFLRRIAARGILERLC